MWYKWYVKYINIYQYCKSHTYPTARRARIDNWFLSRWKLRRKRGRALKGCVSTRGWIQEISSSRGQTCSLAIASASDNICALRAGSELPKTTTTSMGEEPEAWFLGESDGLVYISGELRREETGKSLIAGTNDICSKITQAIFRRKIEQSFKWICFCFLSIKWYFFKLSHVVVTYLLTAGDKLVQLSSETWIE